ncbi:uncharacterized protein LOC141815092 [Curcuma longa]|uniref:uncharacterized protein LOC141815092 n=1 Tax=Curcuma longa TaxID=136217 RepID=UPI003D9EE31D
MSFEIVNTALHAAIIRGHLSVVNLLLSAAPKLATMTNQAEVSPLYMAAEREQLWIVRRILMESPQVSHQGPRGQTALHAAVLRSYEISKMILDKNPSCLKHQDTSKSTRLHFAAASGNVDILRLLLERDASAGYMQDEEGFAIIHIAAKGGGTVNLNMIKATLEHCPDAVEQKNNKGSNFVHVAVEKKNLKVVEYVITSSPSAKELLNEQDHEGNTPLHLAVLMKDGNMIGLLLSSQIADPALTTNSGFTPIDLAFSAVRIEVSTRMSYIMKKLMECGSRFSPQRVDHIRTDSQRMQDDINRYVNHTRTDSQRMQDEIVRYRTLANNLSIVAVLIATVTFAAAFTLPGGYKNDSGSDEGMAILSSRAAFKAFLISDTFAMVFSVLTAFALTQFDPFDYILGDKGEKLRLLGAIVYLVYSVFFLCVAFTTGVYCVIAPDSQWVAITVIIIVFGSVLLNRPVLYLIDIDLRFIERVERVLRERIERVLRVRLVEGNL